MKHDVNLFIQYCRNYLDLEASVAYEYKSLSLCIIDCVYSLRTRYTVTTEVVKNYCKKYPNAEDETISDMIAHFNSLSDISEFQDIIGNHQKLGGKANISKAQVCYKLAKYLKVLGIETIQDFKNFEEQELLEIVISAVKGMGDAGMNYLFMLAGDQDRCKPDVHVHHCMMDIFGEDIDNDECQSIFSEAVVSLKVDYPDLTVRKLDGTIWRKYSRWDGE